jgi:hypothetical protein
MPSWHLVWYSCCARIRNACGLRGRIRFCTVLMRHGSILPSIQPSTGAQQRNGTDPIRCRTERRRSSPWWLWTLDCGSHVMCLLRMGQLFCNLALFEFFSHIYAPGSFISKNGPLARRRHHWRRACVCRRQYYWRLYVRRRCDLD